MKTLSYRFYKVLTLIVLIAIPLHCLFFSEMLSVSDIEVHRESASGYLESASGYCGHCMRYWDDRHYDFVYQKWDCPKFGCWAGGQDLISKVPNNTHERGEYDVT